MSICWGARTWLIVCGHSSKRDDDQEAHPLARWLSRSLPPPYSPRRYVMDCLVDLLNYNNGSLNPFFFFVRALGTMHLPAVSTHSHLSSLCYSKHVTGLSSRGQTTVVVPESQYASSDDCFIQTGSGKERRTNVCAEGISLTHPSPPHSFPRG